MSSWQEAQRKRLEREQEQWERRMRRAWIAIAVFLIGDVILVAVNAIVLFGIK